MHRFSRVGSAALYCTWRLLIIPATFFRNVVSFHRRGATRIQRAPTGRRHPKRGILIVTHDPNPQSSRPSVPRCHPLTPQSSFCLPYSIFFIITTMWPRINPTPSWGKRHIAKMLGTPKLPIEQFRGECVFRTGTLIMTKGERMSKRGSFTGVTVCSRVDLRYTGLLVCRGCALTTYMPLVITCAPTLAHAAPANTF